MEETMQEQTSQEPQALKEQPRKRSIQEVMAQVGWSGPDESVRNGSPEWAALVREPLKIPDYRKQEWSEYLFDLWDSVREGGVVPGMAVLAEGPRGTGKDAAIEQYCAERGFLLLAVNCGRHLDYETLMGTAQVKDGTSYFQPGPIVVAAKLEEALDKPVVLHLVEFNNVKPEHQSCLNTVTDKVGEGELYNPFTNERIVWKSPRIYASINPGYSGTCGIQPALRDRFAVMYATYLPRPEEYALLKGRFPDIEDELVRRAVDTAYALRCAAAGQSYDVRGKRSEDTTPMPGFDLGFRALADFAARVTAGQKENRAWSEAILGRVGFGPREETIRGVVSEISEAVGGFKVIDPTAIPSAALPSGQSAQPASQDDDDDDGDGDAGVSINW